MTSKIIAYLIGLIIFALAGEGGYYLGVNAGKRIGVQETLKNQAVKQEPEKTISPTPISPTVPIIDESVIKWVEQINTLPPSFLLKIGLTTVIGGKFVSMSNNSIILSINDSLNELILPTPIDEIKNVKFSQYNQKEKLYLPDSITKGDLVNGDLITFNMLVQTLKGGTEFLEITKQINVTK